MYNLNPDVTSCDIPPVPEVARWNAEYRESLQARKFPLIDLAPGTPRQPCPELIDRVRDAVAKDAVARYGPNDGSVVLRQALADDLCDLYRDETSPIDLTLDNVCITLGANQALYVVLQTLARFGDEVIITTPFFFNTDMAIRQLGLKPVYLACTSDNGFIPSPSALAELINGRTRAVVLVNPANPTGVTIPSATLLDFAKTCQKHSIALILDETYRDLLPLDWEGHESRGRRAKPHTLFGKSATEQVGAPWQDYLIQLYSFSKGYAIPGYRLGSIIASERTLQQVIKIIDTQTSVFLSPALLQFSLLLTHPESICPAQVAQDAVAWAIPNTVQWRESVRAEVNARLLLFKSAIEQKLKPRGWRVGSFGAYYVLLQYPFEAHSRDVARAMVKDIGVAALPISAFIPKFADGFSMQDNWLRCSIPGVSDHQVLEAVDRLLTFNYNP